MGKQQITASIDSDEIAKMEELRKNAGIPVSTQIEIKLKGYKIVPIADSTILDRLDIIEKEIKLLKTKK